METAASNFGSSRLNNITNSVLTSARRSSSGVTHKDNCSLITRLYVPPLQPVCPRSYSWDAVLQINACSCPQAFRQKTFPWELHDEHLSKLHYLRQAFEVVFMKDATKMFLINAGKSILRKLMTPCHMESDSRGWRLPHAPRRVKVYAKIKDTQIVDELTAPWFAVQYHHMKRHRDRGWTQDCNHSLTPARGHGANICNFEEAYDNLISFTEEPSNYEEIAGTLFSLGVKHVNFYDAVLRLVLLEVLDDFVNIARLFQSCEHKTQIAELHLTVESHGLMYYIGEVLNCLIPDLLLVCVRPDCKQRDFIFVMEGQISSFMREILMYPKENYLATDELAEKISEDLKRRIGSLMSYPLFSK